VLVNALELLLCIRCGEIPGGFFRRLDAGTFGTMGVGVGFAIAASLFAADEAEKRGKEPEKVVRVQISRSQNLAVCFGLSATCVNCLQ